MRRSNEASSHVNSNADGYECDAQQVRCSAIRKTSVLTMKHHEPTNYP